MTFLTLPDPSLVIDCIAESHSSVLVLTYWHASPHLDTDYEIILTLLKRGLHVYYLDVSEAFSVKTCTHPGTVSYRNSVVSLLSCYPNFSLLTHPLPSDPDNCSIDQLLNISDVEDLCGLEYKNYQIGPCLKSYVIDQARTTTPSLPDAIRLGFDAFATAQRLIDCFDRLDISSLVSALVVFNGRYPVAWTAREYFLKAGNAIFYHERGATIYQYQLVDHMPHDYYAWMRGYNELDRIGTERYKNYMLLAQQWLSNKLSKNDQQTINFGVNSVRGLADSLFNATSPATITYFTVSFDEWSSLPVNIYPRSTWSDEFSSLQALLSVINIYRNIRLIIRVHPNNLNKDPMDQSRIHNLHLPPNATLIPANSQIDSYELLSKSSAIFTYGSSIGYEAAYLGLPVYTFGRCLYEKLDGIIPLKTYRDLAKVVQSVASRPLSHSSERSKPEASSNFYHYAFMRQQASLPFAFYSPSNMYSGSFLGLKNPYIDLLRQ